MSKLLMTNRLRSDELSTDELSKGLVVKFLFEAFEVIIRLTILENN